MCKWTKRLRERFQGNAIVAIIGFAAGFFVCILVFVVLYCLCSQSDSKAEAILDFLGTLIGTVVSAVMAYYIYRQGKAISDQTKKINQYTIEDYQTPKAEFRIDEALMKDYSLISYHDNIAHISIKCANETEETHYLSFFCSITNYSNTALSDFYISNFTISSLDGSHKYASDFKSEEQVNCFTLFPAQTAKRCFFLLDFPKVTGDYKLRISYSYIIHSTTKPRTMELILQVKGSNRYEVVP